MARRQRRPLGVAREGRLLIAAAGAVLLLGVAIRVPLVALAGGLVTLALIFFFRDPERAGPGGEGLVVAPADGRVLALEEGVREERYLGGPASRLSIFMSPLDVHVNRSPAAGRVERVEHVRGKFRAAFRGKAAAENERNFILLAGACGERFLMVQIAGALARRIVCRIQPGQLVARGQRLGLIMFGSRVELYVPPAVRLRVRPGQRVRAGETVVGEYRR